MTLQPEQGKTHVLLVDDEPNILIAIEFLLQQAGLEVIRASNGVEALQQLKYRKPHIMVLDVMMPGMDGFEVARRVRQDEQYDKLPIIFLTARGTQEDRFRGYETGAEVYLTKPFDNEELLLTVQETLEFG